MVKDILSQIKYKFSQIRFNRNKEVKKELIESFGKIKIDDTFDFERISKYFKNRDHSKMHQVLSDKTCNDLDFEDLFVLVDHTKSKVGQQYLYNRLRTIELDKSQTKLNEEVIDVLLENTELRISTQQKLLKLKNEEAYYISELFQEEHAKPPKWLFIIKLLSITSSGLMVLSFINPLFFFGLLGVFCINFVIHFWNKKNLAEYISSIPQLLRLNAVASDLNKNVDIKRLNLNIDKSIRVIKQVKSRMSFFQLETRLQGEFEIILWFLFEIFKTVFLLEPLLLFDVLKKLDKKRHEIEEVFQFVGHTDMLIAIASLRSGLETYCIPTILSENRIIASEIYHPLIINCEANSITINEKSILLTGSNMSGKTSFIRAIGLNVITGLTINTCFAKSFAFPLLKIFSAIRISDDLMNDRSYYFEEVLTIKKIIEEGEKHDNNLFLLDEIFKGTNTVERVAAGKAVLSAIARNNNIVLVSTHDVELTDMLSGEYELYHFSEVLNEKNIGFDYKLKMGKLENRNAIRILDINGYPKDVVNEALAISNALDNLKNR
ncbi:MutS-related protein [Winogradskyella flava]|uniref:DNA mismatch repair protein MutS n=1 Tax=Winogradskyella flava TaxID=1884876 RepID=A0A842ITF6_9FLAO|nr:DNA mismatch repair protein MutS [Winogradskyella flava]MBC2846462.1 DNA mismatch repair protein MutS [Winogradskyella flava]